MNYLTPKEKLKIVLDLCDKLHITAYEIGGNTPLNTSGVHRILKKEVRPQSKTIDILYDYVIEKEMEAKHQGSPKSAEKISQAEDPEAAYKNSIQEMVARQVFEKLQPILSDILVQQQMLNRILIKNSVIIDDIKDDLEAIQKLVSSKE